MVGYFKVCKKVLQFYLLYLTSHADGLQKKRLSRITPKWFCELVSNTLLLLRATERWYSFFVFLLDITSLSLFARIRIETHFYWWAHLLIFTKSLLNSFAVVFALWTTKNNEVSSANSFTLDDRPSTISFIYIKNSSGLSMDLWRTPALTSAQEEVYPLKVN